jgi:hypothetical protein
VVTEIGSSEEELVEDSGASASTGPVATTRTPKAKAGRRKKSPKRRRPAEPGEMDEHAEEFLLTDGISDLEAASSVLEEETDQ